jgi:hypothetical protein
MAGLERAIFASNEKMAEADAGCMEVTSFETAMDELLRNFRWTGAAVAYIGLAFLADDKKIRDGGVDSGRPRHHLDLNLPPGRHSEEIVHDFSLVEAVGPQVGDAGQAGRVAGWRLLHTPCLAALKGILSLDQGLAEVHSPHLP